MTSCTFRRGDEELFGNYHENKFVLAFLSGPEVPPFQE